MSEDFRGKRIVVDHHEGQKSETGSEPSRMKIAISVRLRKQDKFQAKVFYIEMHKTC